MFDDPTIELIRSAPGLAGLNSSELPRTLTKAYAEIVGVRMRVREMADGRTNASELLAGISHEIATLRRLAFTQEAMASVGPEGPARRGAAFVSGTAHFVALQAHRLVDAIGEQDSIALSVQGIAPEVSATLLFLAAGASPDAAEMSKEIAVDQRLHPVDQRVLVDIKRLATGRLDEMLADLPLPEIDLRGPDRFRPEYGARALFHMLMKCIHAIAADVLGRDGYEHPLEALMRVESLCSREIARIDQQPVFSTYAGPRHLASLLKMVATELPADSLARIAVPPNLDAAAWSSGLASMAKSRPYLWANHRDAVLQGYLSPGVSSAISFPTGAGKSTLSELKVLATLCKGKDVVFLAPTLALVDQTARALGKAFPNARLSRERANDNPFDFFDETRLQPISVMTPERCVAMLGFGPELFREVGLVVFDECHLLHSAGVDRNRRAIDAMLCVLNLAKHSPLADFLLLSAMMSNTVDVASWLADLTSRPCLALTMAWKPTRQVRGSVVYSATEIDALKVKVAEAATLKPTLKSAPSADLRRQLSAHPLGLLSLSFRWESNRPENYALLKLSEEEMLLSISPDSWRLTPNANQVAAGLAALASKNQQTKSLIFTQTITNALSAQKRAAALLQEEPGIVLSSDEQHLYNLSLMEMGASSALYIDVDEARSVRWSTLCHHGLLLPYERQLHESLFKRPDGIPVLVATSTLAQGMNLPSHVVIIAGDSKFDETNNRLAKMEAHELLNAAGRAGRAGESAYGLVLVIPTRIITVEASSNEPSSNWNELQGIFSQSDQCLAIEDAFEEVLDKIQKAAQLPEEMADYLLRRLPFPTGEEVGDEPAKSLLRKSLSGFLARRRGDSDQLERALEVVMQARQDLQELDVGADWADAMAASFGVPPSILRDLKIRLENTPPLGRSTRNWYEWTVEWLKGSPWLLSELTRTESLDGFMDSKFRKLEGGNDRGAEALPSVLAALRGWISGSTLSDMQRAKTPDAKLLKHCDEARKFVLRLLPDIAHIFSLPELVRRNLDIPGLASLELERLGSCVREGYDSVEKLALARLRGKATSRVGVHAQWNALEFWVDEKPAEETWMQAFDRVKVGVARYERT